MLRWDKRTQTNREDKAVDTFLAAIAQVCRDHQMSIGHEDSHGGFVIRRYNTADMTHLVEGAMLGREL